MTGKNLDPMQAGPFPDRERVVYGRAPLKQVICQVRFPKLLRIEDRAPAEFQERVRSLFPLLEAPPSAAVIQKIPAEFANLLSLSQASNYQFLSEDRTLILALQPDSLTLTANTYSTWENFSALFSVPLTALLEIYSPSFFSRVGLRYVNAIDRAALGPADDPWPALIGAPVLGPLAVDGIEPSVTQMNGSMRLKLGDGDLFLQYGNATLVSGNLPVFAIDIDVFREQKTELEDAEPLLGTFSRNSWRVFRWCITERLHELLEPRPLGTDGSAVANSMAE